MKTRKYLNAAETLKLLIIDTDRRWALAKIDGDACDIRAAFEQVHGKKPTLRAKLWIIPAACSVSDDFSYTIPQDAPRFAWVEVR